MSSINCSEFNRLLAQAVESRLPVDTAELRGHASQCADCRAAWLDSLLVDGALAEWRKTKEMLSPVDMTDIILFRRTAAEEAAVSVGRVPAVAATIGRPRRQLTRRTAAVAATVLATAVCVAFLNGRLRPRQNGPDTAHNQLAAPSGPIGSTKQMPPKIASAGPARPVRAPEAVPKRVADAAVEPAVPDVESAYFGLASEAAQAVAAATALAPRSRPAVATARADGENDRWVEDVGREFEPLGKHLSQAFQFLLEAVPDDKAPAT